MEGERGVSIKFISRKEQEESLLEVNPDLFHEGRLFASQQWVTKGDIGEALRYVTGKDSSYNAMPVVYEFEDSRGRTCYLVGDGHHRIAQGLLHEDPIVVKAEVDARLGVLSDEVLENPDLAAQNLAVLGVSGIWPFHSFMEKLVEVKTQMKKGDGK